MVTNPAGVGLEKYCGVTVNYRITLSSEWALHMENTSDFYIISKEEKEYFVAVRRWRSDSRKDWPTDRRSQNQLNFNSVFVGINE
jgi:hypothetical protein